MYCSSCGVSVATGLIYCNYCGARLNPVDRAKSSEVRPESLIAAMGAVFIFGLVAIAVLMGTMKAVLYMDMGQILGLTFLSFLIMMLLEGVFIYLLLRRKRDTETNINPA